MANWYGVLRIVDSVVISFVSDDSAGFSSLAPGLKMIGPYATQDVAIAALLPITQPQLTIMNALRLKDAATWTLTDLATWLQNGG